MLTETEASQLKWSESLYFVTFFNFLVQPLFMIARYRRLTGDAKKAMLPAMFVVPLFNIALVDYCGRKM